jgi:hypothetical protein
MCQSSFNSGREFLEFLGADAGDAGRFGNLKGVGAIELAPVAEEALDLKTMQIA